MRGIGCFIDGHDMWRLELSPLGLHSVVRRDFKNLKLRHARGGSNESHADHMHDMKHQGTAKPRCCAACLPCYWVGEGLVTRAKRVRLQAGSCEDVKGADPSVRAAL